MSVSEQDRARLDPWGHANPGRDRVAGRAQPVARDPQRGIPFDGSALGLPPVAGGAGHLPQALAGLVALGFEGANVTMPHKTEAADLADELTEDARLLRAANTLTVQNGAILGDNTDAPGFERFLQADAGFEARGASALLFGAGGAARAVALALARSGVAALTVAAREPATAMAIVELLDRFPVEVRAVPLGEADRIRGGPGRQRHARGRRRGRDASRSGSWVATVIVVDLVYRSMTPLLASAERTGAASFSGLGLLVHQAALSFERWTERPAPLAVMADAARAASADQA